MARFVDVIRLESGKGSHFREPNFFDTFEEAWAEATRLLKYDLAAWTATRKVKINADTKEVVEEYR